ncbi:unnamed protein product [Sphagnum tenellum]
MSHWGVENAACAAVQQAETIGEGSFDLAVENAAYSLVQQAQTIAESYFESVRHSRKIRSNLASKNAVETNFG